MGTQETSCLTDHCIVTPYIVLKKIIDIVELICETHIAEQIIKIDDKIRMDMVHRGTHQKHKAMPDRRDSGKQ